MKSFCGYCFRFCKFCNKETFHYLLEGEGCRAYLCLNAVNHDARCHVDYRKEVK